MGEFRQTLFLRSYRLFYDSSMFDDFSSDNRATNIISRVQEGLVVSTVYSLLHFFVYSVGCPQVVLLVE